MLSCREGALTSILDASVADLRASDFQAIYAGDTQSRSYLMLPHAHNVDFRASCFCHKVACSLSCRAHKRIYLLSSMELHQACTVIDQLDEKSRLGNEMFSGGTTKVIDKARMLCSEKVPLLCRGPLILAMSAQSVSPFSVR